MWRTARTTVFCVALLGAALAAGCKGGILELHFHVGRSIPSQTISGSITPCSLASQLPVTLLSNPFGVDITQQQDFPQQNTDVNHITDAQLDELTLTLTSSSPTQNWDFLDDLTISAAASGLETVVVASIGSNTPSGEAIPQGTTTLALKSAGVNLAPYIKASGGFSMTSSAQGCAPSQDADFTGQVDFAISADPL